MHNKSRVTVYLIAAAIFGLWLWTTVITDKLEQISAPETRQENTAMIASDDAASSEDSVISIDVEVDVVNVLSSEPEHGSTDSGHVIHDVEIDEYPDAPPAVSEVTEIDGTPALAVVVDDCGFNMKLARRLKDRPLTLTWAILPGQAYSRAIADMLREDGTPFIIHVPMQAMPDPDGVAGQKGMYSIGVGMDESSVVSSLAGMIEALPGAYGINNHRGSKATADYKLMRSVMKELRRRGMFFLDSSTTKDTLAYKAARAVNIECAKNNHFLDNESDRNKIRTQFDRAIEVAKKRRSAVAICHIRPETIAFLDTVDDRYFASRGVRLVTLPELVELRKEFVRDAYVEKK